MELDVFKILLRHAQHVARIGKKDITAIAHKLLPLFTMLGATRCIPALTWMVTSLLTQLQVPILLSPIWE